MIIIIFYHISPSWACLGHTGTTCPSTRKIQHHGRIRRTTCKKSKRIWFPMSCVTNGRDDLPSICIIDSVSSLLFSLFTFFIFLYMGPTCILSFSFFSFLSLHSVLCPLLLYTLIVYGVGNYMSIPWMDGDSILQMLMTGYYLQPVNCACSQPLILFSVCIFLYLACYNLSVL